MTEPHDYATYNLTPAERATAMARDRERLMRNWPVFGVWTEGEPELAHVFKDRRLSLCGAPLRRMAEESETELPTCRECADAASRAAHV